MLVKFYDSVREYKNLKKEFDSAIEKVMKRGDFILGKEVKELEDEIKKFTGAKHAAAVASGTDALVITADILGFKKNREVITTPFTFFSSVSSITRNGGKPVFVDIDEETFNMNADLIEEKITEKTSGILPVHLFLQISDMNKIMKTADKYNLRVLEDSAEAFGMKIRTSDDNYLHAGTIGDFGIFSFYPTKTLGAYGDAGMIITNNDELFEKAKSYRIHGASKKYYHEYIGYNSRLDTIQAAVLLIKLKHIKNSIERRNKLAEIYNKELSSIAELRFPKIKGDQKHVYYVFNILTSKRDELSQHLKENNIQHTIYYPKPLHLQDCFQYLGYKKGDFPVSEKISEEILALPMYPELTEEEIKYTADKIKEFFIK